MPLWSCLRKPRAAKVTLESSSVQKKKQQTSASALGLRRPLLPADVDRGLLDRLNSINNTLTTQWNRLQSVRNTVDDTGTRADRARSRVQDAESLIDRARQELEKAKDAVSKVVSLACGCPMRFSHSPDGEPRGIRSSNEECTGRRSRVEMTKAAGFN